MLKHELDSETNSIVIPALPEAPLELEPIVAAEVCVAIDEFQCAPDLKPVKRPRKNIHTIVLAVCGCSFLLGFPAGMMFSSLVPGNFMVAPLIIGAIASFAGLVGVPFSLISMYSGNVRAVANEPMPAETGISAIGPLLDRMSKDVANTKAIRDRLTDLLFQLTNHDTLLLESRHYRQLNTYLQRIAWEFNTVREAERAYLLSVLHAYSCVGDPHAKLHVERIAQGKANTKVRDDEVRAAAGCCLEYLTVAAAQLTHHNTLLRSAHISEPSAELVRPAGTGAEIDPVQLMRATSDVSADK